MVGAAHDVLQFVTEGASAGVLVEGFAEVDRLTFDATLESCGEFAGAVDEVVDEIVSGVPPRVVVHGGTIAMPTDRL